MTRASLGVSLVLALGACGGPSGSSDDTASGSSPSGNETASTSGAESGPTDGTAASGEPTAADTGQGPAADLQEYAGRVMAQVRRHWQIPATLSPSEAAILEASIEISYDEATRLPTGYRVVEASGNAVFDESIMRGLQALVDAHEPLPEPPVGLDDRDSVRLRLRGRR